MSTTHLRFPFVYPAERLQAIAAGLRRNAMTAQHLALAGHIESLIPAVAATYAVMEGHEPAGSERDAITAALQPRGVSTVPGAVEAALMTQLQKIQDAVTAARFTLVNGAPQAVRGPHD